MSDNLQCVQCLVRQTVDAARLLTSDATIHRLILNRAFNAITSGYGTQSTVVMAGRVHRAIRDAVGQFDPYQSVKERSNRMALDLYPQLRQYVLGFSDPLELAIRFSIAGNIIDFGAMSDVSQERLHRTVRESLDWKLEQHLLDDIAKAAAEAESILFIGDNAGEIVFDRILIEQLPLEKVTYVVRGSPVLNDATVADAEAVGLFDLVEVIDTGAGLPGVALETCSPQFRERFEDASLVIAKGQGNYEGLCNVDKDVFFLLQVKCDVVGREFGCPPGTPIIARSQHASVKRGTEHASV